MRSWIGACTTKEWKYLPYNFFLRKNLRHPSDLLTCNSMNESLIMKSEDAPLTAVLRSGIQNAGDFCHCVQQSLHLVIHKSF